MKTRDAVQAVIDLLLADDGLRQSLREINLEAWLEANGELESEIRMVQAPLDLVEKAFPLRRPMISVYCRKFSNELGERFTKGGATFEIVIEVLTTHDRLESLRPVAMDFADAVVGVVERKSGCLGNHLLLRERVDVTYEGAKRGGLHVAETARIACTLEWRKS